jgi:predicted nucleotide-binding protein
MIASGSKPGNPRTLILELGDDSEMWGLDDEQEWYAEYGRGFASAHIRISWPEYRLILTADSEGSKVEVKAQHRPEAEKVMRIFSSKAAQYELPALPVVQETPQPPVVVFIGHGHSTDWRTVKDQLQDQHGYTVEAYEVGERAGHSIRDVLDAMLERSTFALLMMTGEDSTADEGTRARQNVVHEAGLFQGRLGFNRAIAVVEQGVEVFSNLNGIDQIRYPKGHVEVAVARILATLRREFGDRR